MSYGSSAAEYSTFSLFATQLAVGVVAVLPLVPLAGVGRRFFILVSLVSVVLIGLALLDRGLALDDSYFAMAGVLAVYNLSLPSRPRSDPMPGPPRRISFSTSRRVMSGGLLMVAIASGMAGVVSDATAYAQTILGGAGLPVWLAASSVSSAILLGSSLLALILGHWYLVARGLSFAALRHVTVVLAAALVVRLALALLCAWVEREYWQDAFTRHEGVAGFVLAYGVFLLPRFVFGALVPLALVLMVWKCVQIRSNQSATGILYVVVAFVLLGEMLAKQILVTWNVLV